MSLTVADIELLMRAHAPLQPIEHISVEDQSGGCGSAFAIRVVSAAFDGLRLIERHRLIHAALGAKMDDIHALQLKCLTPAAYAKQQQSGATTTATTATTTS